MTCTVTVQVPERAHYVAEVTVKNGPGERHVYVVSPGDTLQTYVYAEREISVREVPLNNPTIPNPN
jgi:hypothetical protein